MHGVPWHGLPSIKVGLPISGVLCKRLGMEHGRVGQVHAVPGKCGHGSVLMKAQGI